MNKAALNIQQSGVVLVISLIMLVVLTLIGLTGTQVTSLEEKMASNSKDLNLAFQAAEAGLRAGEDGIDAVVALSAFDGTNGLLGEDNDEPDFKSSTIWYGDNSVEFDSGIVHIAKQPRYVVKYITTKEDSGEAASPIVGNHGEIPPGTLVSYFTVTAQGTGGQDSSQVFLKSYFGKKF